MVERTANAEWKGGLQSGAGTLKLGSGAYEGAYSFKSRFAEGTGTNPEELIGAAHAGCFSMAFAAGLEKAGFPATSVRTSAKVTFEKVGDGFAITRIALDTEGNVPGIDEARFRDEAESAKRNCPVSKALAATQITLNARLVR